MKQLLRLPSFYLSMPLLATCGLTLLTYDLPPDYLEGLLLLVTMALAIFAFDVVAGIRLPTSSMFRRRDYTGTRDADNLWQVKTAQQTFSAPIIINAAGALKCVVRCLCHKRALKR